MVQDDILTLLRKHQDEPRVHHVRSFLKEPDKQDLQSEQDSQKAAELESKYASAFAQGLLAAAPRVYKDHPGPEERTKRESARPELQGFSPWMRAQIDVYQHIIQSQKQFSETDPADWFPVADVGQTASRGAIQVTGELPCITTSSKIYAYDLHRTLTPDELMACHGFVDYNFSGLTTHEAAQLVGKGMAATSLVTVLAPVLKHLNFLS